MSINHVATKINQNLKMFWWPSIKSEVSEFVLSCLTFQNSKIEHYKLSGLMQPLSIIEWKWDKIYMDFVKRLTKASKGSDLIWVVMDILTKSAHFILRKIGYSLQKLAEAYIHNIVSVHGNSFVYHFR